MMKYHNPVLLKETVEGLNIKPDGVYVDVTFGGGGHSKEILKRLGPNGKLFGFDQDEDAFAKLSRYLEAVKKSISDPVGGDEIIQDIEARIAELFSERLEINTQVISTRELDAIIEIMGQPEDYIMDEDAAQTNSATGNQTKGETTSNKQLFRD